jgi:hypothetical protein
VSCFWQSCERLELFLGKLEMKAEICSRGLRSKDIIKMDEKYVMKV